MPRNTDPDEESGVLLRPGDYPMLKRKPQGPPEDEPMSIKGPSFKDKLRNVPWKKVGTHAGVGVLGILIGYLLHGSGGSDTGPKVKKELDAAKQQVVALQTELTTAKTALDAEKETTDKLTKENAKLAPKVEEAKALETKLAAVVGGKGEVSSADGEIRLQLVDKILFRTGEANLTAEGQEVLSSIGTALNDKDVEDKQIWVQGHTDDDPISVPKPPKGSGKTGKGGKGGKGGKTAAPVAPLVQFASNWELSAARALTVVHYLQDQVKVDPRRLAAVAFGQWRPASKTKAKNRRIEIVLYPKHVVSPK